ncbi:MAG: T9SS type A sorting domain-containing protein [Nitrosopumilus sp.]|nr:T9SS type A sorting domain-containing protein [Nitrosopumilus sp.]
MKHLVLLIFYLLSASLTRAQLTVDKLFLDSAMNTSSGKFISTFDNGTAFCGSQFGTQPGNLPQTGHIVKLNASYNFQWAKRYSKGISSSTLFLKDFVQLADNGYLALCEIRDSVGPSSYTFSMAVMRTDSTGSLLYIKSISDSTAPFVNEPVSITAITDTTFYIGTNAWGNIGSIGICKINISGTILKSQYFRVENTNHTARLHSIIKLINGQFLITGSDNITWVSAKRMNFLSLDDDLNVVWYKTYYSPNQYIVTNKVLQDSDSSIWVFGQLQISNANPTPLIIKLNQSADLVWANKYTPSLNFPMDFRTAIKWNNSFLAAGTNGYPLSYIPYVLKIDTSGAILSSKTFTHSNLQYFILDLAKQNDSLTMFISSKLSGALIYGRGIAIMDSTFTLPCSNNDMFFTSASNTFTLDSAINITNVSMLSNDITSQYQTSSFSLYEAGLCTTTSIDESLTAKNEISIYPNPFHSSCVFEMNKFDITSALDLFVYDIYGKLVRREIIEKGKLIFYRGNLSDGVYLFQIKEKSMSIMNGKIVIQ